MIPHPFDNFIWALYSIAEAILVVVILKKGAARRWPFLLVLALFDLGHNYLLYTHLGEANYRQYFYIYWYGHGARALLSLGLIFDVARSMPGLKYVPQYIGVLLLAFGLAITIGSVFLTKTHHPSPEYSQIVARVLMMRECAAVAWMCLALSLLGSISILGLGWLVEPLSVTGGVVISGLAAMLAANLTSSRPKSGHLIDQIHTLLEIAVLLSWSVMLCRPSFADNASSDYALIQPTELSEEQSLK